MIYNSMFFALLVLVKFSRSQNQGLSDLDQKACADPCRSQAIQCVLVDKVSQTDFIAIRECTIRKLNPEVEKDVICGDCIKKQLTKEAGLPEDHLCVEDCRDWQKLCVQNGLSIAKDRGAFTECVWYQGNGNCKKCLEGEEKVSLDFPCENDCQKEMFSCLIEPTPTMFMDCVKKAAKERNIHSYCSQCLVMSEIEHYHDCTKGHDFRPGNNSMERCLAAKGCQFDKNTGHCSEEEKDSGNDDSGKDDSGKDEDKEGEDKEGLNAPNFEGSLEAFENWCNDGDDARCSACLGNKKRGECTNYKTLKCKKISDSSLCLAIGCSLKGKVNLRCSGKTDLK